MLHLRASDPPMRPSALVAATLIARGALVGLAAAAWLLAPSSALADCEPAGPIEQVLAAAPVAFVGTVVATEGPVATFAVTEVWAGEIGESIEVRGVSDEVGGPDAGSGAGFAEDDRHWTEGATYLVVPFVDGAVLRDHICTATTEWRADLEEVRPADARTVTATDEAPTGVPLPVVLVAAMLVAIAGASFLAFRRR
jgi:hypothetical protein